MKTKILKLAGGFAASVLLFYAYSAVAETAKAAIDIPKPQEFSLNLAFFFGLMAGVAYKALIGTIKNLYRGQFSWKKLLFPIIANLLLSIPAIIFLIPNLAKPSGKFLPDFLYAFVVAYIFVDFSADLSKLAETLASKKTEEPKGD